MHEPQVARPADAAASALERAAERILAATRTRAFLVVVVSTYVVISLVNVARDRYLHDEGLLTFLFGSFLSRDFVATFFYLKAKPVLALLNLPGAVLGTRGFFVWHVGLGALGIVLVHRAARALRLREAGGAALIVAFSPMYLAGGASGISNVDGVFACALAIVVLAGARPGLTSGVVVSLLPFVRFELGLFALLAGGAVVVRDRNPRFVLGLAAFPVFYGLAGALYHRDPIWFIHFPASPWGFQHHAVVSEEISGLSPAVVGAGVTTTTPLIGTLLLPRRVRGPARVGLVFAGAYLLAMIALPLSRHMFGYAERYFLQALPIVALLFAKLLEEEEGRASFAVLAFVGALALHGAAAWLPVLSLALVLVFAGGLYVGLPRLGAVITLAFAVVWPALAPMVDLHVPVEHERLGVVERFVREHRVTGPVYTNLKLADAYLVAGGRAPGVIVRCIIHEDNLHELSDWTNAANGQRDRILALARWRFYGEGVLAQEVVRDAPAGSLLVVDEDPRLGALRSQLLARAEVVMHRDGLVIARFK